MIDKRAARAAAKEAPERWVIYAARTGGLAWVGATPNLAAVENRLRFELRMGTCRAPGMQAADDGALTLEPLEELNPKLGPHGRDEAISRLRAQWASRLGATELPR